jgi:hypothetical protein
MSAVTTAWAISAAVLLLGSAAAGLLVRDRGLNGPSRLLGILIDDRGRYSLTRFQITLWSILVISVVAGLFYGRLASGSAATALDFKIPPELLAAMGISAGSAAAATAVKASKNATRPEAVAASGPQDLPRWTQMLLREEGSNADKVIDIAKFQNFWITIFLVGAYTLLVGAAISKAKTVGDFVLPGFSATFLTLLGISHAGYIAGKLPNPSGIPDGLTLLKAQQPEQVEPGSLMAEKAENTRNPVGQNASFRASATQVTVSPAGGKPDE